MVSRSGRGYKVTTSVTNAVTKGRSSYAATRADGTAATSYSIHGGGVSSRIVSAGRNAGAVTRARRMARPRWNSRRPSRNSRTTANDATRRTGGGSAVCSGTTNSRRSRSRTGPVGRARRSNTTRSSTSYSSSCATTTRNTGAIYHHSARTYGTGRRPTGL